MGAGLHGAGCSTNISLKPVQQSKVQTLALLFSFGTFNSLLAGLERNRQYSVEIAHQPVKTSSAKQTLKAYSSNIYAVQIAFLTHYSYCGRNLF